MSKGGFKIISSALPELPKEIRRLDNINAEVATDVLNRAIMNAPKASGALVRSGRVIPNPSGKGWQVQFGDNAVRYAYLRHFVNKKNPQTLLYLSKAGESVIRGNLGKYFR